MSASLRHLTCGSTGHAMHRLFHLAAAEHRRFPSGVFLYDAGVGRRVLFDTGYATGRWDTGLRGAAYRRLLPPEVDDADDVAQVLAAAGTSADDVDHVVLSHLHPDHIGGVRRFPDATVHLTRGQVDTLAAARMRDGILPGLLPAGFPGQGTRVWEDSAFVERDVRGVSVRAADLFADASYVLVDLPGHASGHIGALVEGRVLLAGDAAWGADLLAEAPRMRALPRAVQADYPAYVQTAHLLRRLAEAGIRVVCSHDPVTDPELLT